MPNTTLNTQERLDLLRHSLTDHGVDGLLLPHRDEFDNEYLPACHERLAWLTGFTGSAGSALILQDSAYIFTDGRYTIQVLSEVDTELIQPVHLASTTLFEWLSENLSAGLKIGLDPWTLAVGTVQRLSKVIEQQQSDLIYLDGPIDEIWEGQPPFPKNSFTLHDPKYAGQSSADKIEQISEDLAAKHLDAFVLTDPSSICWLLNIRGEDIPYNPLVLSWAIVHSSHGGSGQVDWFINPQKAPNRELKQLPEDVTVHLDQDFEAGLRSLSNKRVGLAFDSAPRAIYNILQESRATIMETVDPCALPRACKNTTEQNGARAAHHRDGLAVTQFVDWVTSETEAQERLTEISAADHLEKLRQKNDLYKGLSFPTISAVAGNAAVVHYHPSESSNRPLRAEGVKGDIYLVDSGGHYLDGTTDITRTLWISSGTGTGAPPSKVIEAYTRVLKGLIQLSQAQFPKGTSGGQLDVLARQFLWDAGLDFEHGTGHGVGSYLCVHEGPQRISKKYSDVALEPGMILSNEPGYYEAGEFGIRLENLILVVDGDKEGWLQFETLTTAPFQHCLIDPKLLTQTEKSWLNAYHTRLFKAYKNEMDAEALKRLIPKI